MLKDSFLQPFDCHDRFIKNSFIDPDNISLRTHIIICLFSYYLNMSAGEQLSQLADQNLGVGLINLLPDLLKPDTAEIQKATDQYRHCQKMKHFYRL